MNSLTEFLLARIAEDEQAVRALPRWPADASVSTQVREVHDYLARWQPARVLAECEAKRRIVEEAEQFGTWEGGMGDVALRLLATVYADHPDYREDWRPF